MSRYGASTFSSLLDKCVLWAPLQHSVGVSGDIDEFPILPSGVTVTPNGTFTKTDLGNNKSVLNFDGSSNYIEISPASALNFMHQVGTAGKWSVGFWYKWNNRTAETSFISNTTTYGSHGFMLYGDTSRFLISVICANIHPNYVFSGSSATPLPNDSDWHYIVITYDQSLTTNNCKMYCDGVSISGTASKTAYSASTSDATNAGAIGAWNSGEGGKLNGNIKDLMMFNGRILTLPEIKLLMNRTHPITGAGLMPANGDYWRLS